MRDPRNTLPALVRCIPSLDAPSGSVLPSNAPTAALVILALRLFDHPDELAATRAMGLSANDVHEGLGFLWKEYRMLPDSLCFLEDWRCPVWQDLARNGGGRDVVAFIARRLPALAPTLKKGLRHSFAFDYQAFWFSEGATRLIEPADDHPALDMMRRATESVDEGFDLYSCAKVWCQLDRREEMQACLDRLKPLAHNPLYVVAERLSTGDWKGAMEALETGSKHGATYTALHWLNDVGLPEEARRHAPTVESVGTDADLAAGLHFCPLLWDRLGDRQESIRWMGYLEKRSERAYDWIGCARNWMRLGSQSDALRCIGNATLCSGRDFQGEARFWLNCGRESAARNALRAAQAKAVKWLRPKKASAVLRNMSYHWSVLGDLERAQEALAQAEALAEAAEKKVA